MKNILGNYGLRNNKIANLIGNSKRVIDGDTSTKKSENPPINIYGKKDSSPGFNFDITFEGEYLTAEIGIDGYLGTELTVLWGDGTSDTVIGGEAVYNYLQHTYASIGTYRVEILEAKNIYSLYLFSNSGIFSFRIGEDNLSKMSRLTNLRAENTAFIGESILSTNRLPNTLTFLYLDGVSGVAWNISSLAPIPPNLTWLYIINCPSISYNVTSYPLLDSIVRFNFSNSGQLEWAVSAGSPIPSAIEAVIVQGATVLSIVDFDQFKKNTMTVATLINNALSVEEVDGIAKAIWENKANYLDSGTLEIQQNSTPTGTYQEAHPPTTGMEYIYDLEEEAHTTDGPKWAVSFDGEPEEF